LDSDDVAFVCVSDCSYCILIDNFYICSLVDSWDKGDGDNNPNRAPLLSRTLMMHSSLYSLKECQFNGILRKAIVGLHLIQLNMRMPPRREIIYVRWPF